MINYSIGRIASNAPKQCNDNNKFLNSYYSEDPCKDDPCKNNGYCVQLMGQSSYRCDCYGTGYFGPHCHKSKQHYHLLLTGAKRLNIWLGSAENSADNFFIFLITRVPKRCKKGNTQFKRTNGRARSQQEALPYGMPLTYIFL